MNENSIVAVTGAASGIGAATATQLRKQGCRVITPSPMLTAAK